MDWRARPAERDRYTLVLSADDGSNPRDQNTTRSATGCSCPGSGRRSRTRQNNTRTSRSTVDPPMRGLKERRCLLLDDQPGRDETSRTYPTVGDLASGDNKTATGRRRCRTRRVGERRPQRDAVLRVRRRRSRSPNNSIHTRRARVYQMTVTAAAHDPGLCKA